MFIHRERKWFPYSYLVPAHNFLWSRQSRLVYSRYVYTVLRFRWSKINNDVESPRWLMANDRYDEAIAVLAKYHGEGDANHPIVQLQMKEMTTQILTDGSDKKFWDYRELWNSHSARRRLICVIGMATFGQLSGNSATGYYLPVMAEKAGISDPKTQLVINGIYPCICFVAAVIGARLCDVVGRRPLLLYSTIFCSMTFLVIL